MYKNILLLLDCSEYDKAIIKHIKNLVQIHKSHVHIYHAVHAHTVDQQRALIAKTKKCLNEAMSTLKEIGIDVDSSYTEGEPEEEVIKKIDEHKWDLIAMATHGHKFFGDAIFGSISDRIKHYTNIPILLIKGNKK